MEDDPVERQNMYRGFMVAGWVLAALTLMILMEVLSTANEPFYIRKSRQVSEVLR